MKRLWIILLMIVLTCVTLYALDLYDSIPVRDSAVSTAPPVTTPVDTPIPWTDWIVKGVSLLIVVLGGKFLGLKLTETEVQRLIWVIVGWCRDAEKNKGLTTGIQRQAWVISRINQAVDDDTDRLFTDRRRSLLVRMFGSMEGIVAHALTLGGVLLKK